MPGDPAIKNAWGTLLDVSDFSLIDTSIAGVLTLNVAGNSNIALTYVQGSADQSRNPQFVLTGALTGNILILWPAAVTRNFGVVNNTTGAFTVTLCVNNGSGGAAGNEIVIQTGLSALCYSDGTNIEWRQVGFGINQPMNGLKLTGLGTGTATGDSIAYGQGNVAFSHITLGNGYSSTINTGENTNVDLLANISGQQLFLSWNSGDGFANCVIASSGAVTVIASSNALGALNSFDTNNNVNSNGGIGIALFASGASVFLQSKTNGPTLVVSISVLRVT